MDICDRTKLSEAICFVMESVGYDDDMRMFRIQEYDKISKIGASKLVPIKFAQDSLTLIQSGSKSEGVSLPFQGDYDCMLVDDNIVCVDEPGGFSEFSILKTEYNDMSPPGYVKVIAENLKLNSTVELFCLNSCLYQTEDGKQLISSAMFRNTIQQIISAHSCSNYDYMDENETSSSGLAATRSYSMGHGLVELSYSIDIVFSIYLYSSKFFQHWKRRQRHWPPSALIEEIAQSEGYIVPVGSIESDRLDLEWRVSYVTAEQKLVRSLNATQAKLYVVLKMIFKELLGSECSAISSYVMKNVVLWVCELYSSEMFVPNLLLDHITTALLFVKQCLQNNHLPNYIIPHRNLISGRLSVLSKKRLIGQLSILLSNRTRIFYELNIFRKHMSLLCMSPSSINSYKEKRNKIEKLFINESAMCTNATNVSMASSSAVIADVLGNCFKDERFFEIRMGLINLVIPEWTTLFFTDPQMTIKLYSERLNAYLS